MSSISFRRSDRCICEPIVLRVASALSTTEQQERKGARAFVSHSDRLASSSAFSFQHAMRTTRVSLRRTTMKRQSYSSIPSRSASSLNMDCPATRLHEMRKRMRTGENKYSIPGHCDESSYDDSPEDTSLAVSAELVELLHLQESSQQPMLIPAEQPTTPRDHKNNQVFGKLRTPFFEQPSLQLSPPPTPGKVRYNDCSDSPQRLPLGQHFDSWRSKAASSSNTENTGGTTRSRSNDANNVFPGEKGLVPPLPTTRLKPTFVSKLAQDLVADHLEINRAGDNVQITPHLPFQYASGVLRRPLQLPEKLSSTRLSQTHPLLEDERPPKRKATTA